VSLSPPLLPAPTGAAVAVVIVSALSATAVAVAAAVGDAIPRYCSTLRRRLGLLVPSFELSSALTLLRRL
jgi:hypothetical protein